MEEKNELNASLYPNPNRGDFSFIVYQESEGIIQYQLFDQNGKLLLQNSSEIKEFNPISIQNPSSGIYHLKIFDGYKNSSFKINIIP